MKGHYIPYSAEELAFIEWRQAMSRSALLKEFVARFGRTDVSLSNLSSLCKRNGWFTGRDGRFKDGQEPANKGQPCPPGKGGRHHNARKTQFKKGVRCGKAARLYKPIGSERLCKDGYVERKVHDGMPMQSRWRAVHLIRWEAINGSLPDGHCLKCLDGDKTNTDPSNWEAIPRALLPRLSGRFGRAYDTAPDEIKPTIMATAKLEHRAREARMLR